MDIHKHLATGLWGGQAADFGATPRPMRRRGESQAGHERKTGKREQQASGFGHANRLRARPFWLGPTGSGVQWLERAEPTGGDATARRSGPKVEGLNIYWWPGAESDHRHADFQARRSPIERNPHAPR